MSAFDDYTANTLAGMKAGAGDVTRHAIADIGDTYQEILMSHSSVSAPDGLTGTMENVTVEIEPTPAADVTPPQPEIDLDY
jgi:hypothetical protein